jgi:hypothetical protein
VTTRVAHLFSIALSASLALACGEPTEPTAIEPEVAPAAAYRSAAVDGALDAAMRAARTRGYSAEGVPFRGFAVEQSTAVDELSLESGSCYALVATASGGVRDLDLALFDADGSEAARDTTSGSSAALTFCPVTSGTYYGIVRATVGSGLFGVRLFRGPTGLDVSPQDLVLPPAEAAP